mmetsp:Transcript_10727/g.22051  ORF Transcript_10727/g.22051 Transcript_10727/m.22051 type:complete len:93 (+) Transcript_10727:2223-2501(+)
MLFLQPDERGPIWAANHLIQRRGETRQFIAIELLAHFRGDVRNPAVTAAAAAEKYKRTELVIGDANGLTILRSCLVGVLEPSTRPKGRFREV